MAKLQRDDAKALWKQLGDHRNWSRLARLLEGHLEKSQGIENTTVKALICEARDFDLHGDAFPDSAGKLFEVVNEKIDHYRNCDPQAADSHPKTAHRVEDHHRREPAHRSPTANNQSVANQQPASENRPGENEQARNRPGGSNRREWSPTPNPPRTTEPARQRNINSREGQNKSSDEGKVAVGKSPAEIDQPAKQVQYPIDVENNDLSGQHQKRRARLVSYEPENLEVLYKRGNWKNWDEMIGWLQKQASTDDDFTKEMVQAMINDLRELKASGVPFNQDHDQVFEIIHRQENR